ncbi:hypothetical protein K443DRAFT_680851 [Laccaria amethystina LaAM-08-1]|uniref:Uncharacterized protein n=1 Tax=Laccaria amethystina LaAM-08-1 TaxID=1095629 RepID=A0A0C9XAG7_9AGAR|nr:hypothetical protein K443DRAFT_680851 [Laccaria amethystina LaAM-08-1]
MATPCPPAEALPVLCATFAKIEEKLIESIITHQLLAQDLYKLQPQYTLIVQEPWCHSSPLHVYFAILNEYLNHSTITLVFFRYLNHLRDLINVYEWPTVLEYHQSYFDHRVFDMRTWGEFGSWGLPDCKLMNQLGFTHPCMSTPEIMVPTQQLRVLGYREEPLLPITFILRRLTDPFGDYKECRDGHVTWRLNHTIYEQLSLFHLPYPFQDCSDWHYGILHGTNFVKGNSNRGEVPVKEVIKLLSYEAGKIPFLNLVAYQDFENSKKDAKKRSKV